MRYPVVCADGHSYEREAITLWLATNDTSPATNMVLPNKNLTPNHALRNMIEEQEQVVPMIGDYATPVDYPGGVLDSAVAEDYDAIASDRSVVHVASDRSGVHGLVKKGLYLVYIWFFTFIREIRRRR